jgi:hypothetical protein
MFVPPDWLKYIFSWLKIPANYFIPVLAASYFGLFAPLDLLQFLGISFWREDYKPYLGSVFVVSVAIVGCHFGTLIIRWIVSKYQYVLGAIRMRGRLKRLSIEEQKVLARYLKGKTRTQLFPIDNGVVRGLVASKILYAAVVEGDIYKFPLNMQPWAWDYLNKHPNLVGVIVKQKLELEENTQPVNKPDRK